MTIEQRIINVAEKQNYYDSRELRAIALEVRKREDRIKQLEEMYEGIPGERPDLLGTNVMGLLKREIIGTQKRIKRLEEALTWYESKVSDCNRHGPEGDAARDALAKDLGHKAKEAKL